MFLRQNKSKWQVCGDSGHVFREYKTRGRAEKGKRLFQLYGKWGNGLTPAEEAEVKRLQRELGEKC